MSITLSLQDHQVLQEIAKSTSAENTSQIYADLCRGYETYSTEEMIARCGEGRELSEDALRSIFFENNANRLLTNLVYAGQESAVVFVGMRQHILNTFKRFGIPERDRDEITDYAIFKLWYFRHAEKYNPLTSAWTHHVHLSLWRIAASYYERRSRDPLSLGFAFQQYGQEGDSINDEFQLEPYELEQDPSPEDKMIVAEALQDFEFFLRKQKPYRTGVEGCHKEVCTLLPDNPLHALVQEPTFAYIVRFSDKNSRVELKDGERFLYPSRLVTDRKPNEERDNQDARRILRTPLALYHLIMDKGAQVEEIGLILKVGSSTAHNWIRKLEEHFQTWWKLSKHIHFASKWCARPVRVCPGCGEAHLELPPKVVRPGVKTEWEGVVLFTIPSLVEAEATLIQEVSEVEASWCDECYQWTLDNLRLEVRLPYPWGHIRGTHNLQERSAKYKPKLLVQRCSI